MTTLSPRPLRGDDSALCSAITPKGKGCQGDPFPGAPVLLCATHLRQSYEFAADLINARWADALTEQQITDQDAEERRRRMTEHRRMALDDRHQYEPLKPESTEGLVYFIRFGDRIKIGFTTNLQSRMKAIPYDEILMVTPGTMDDERQCHQAFAHLRETGEWFRADPELLAFIGNMPDNEASRRHCTR